MEQQLLCAPAPAAPRQLKGIFCATCEVNFAGTLEHKEHYAAEHHRYNLRRRVLGLAPISLEAFEENKRHVAGLGGKLAANKAELGCAACKKAFGSRETLEQHLASRKHRQAAQRPPAAAAERPPELSARADPAVCLFCTRQGDSFAENLRHMAGAHGFFVPREESCTDVQGLCARLARKIEADLECIHCEYGRHHAFGRAADVRQHMRVKGHTAPHPRLLGLYARFYAAAPAGEAAAGESEEWVSVDEDEDEDGPAEALRGAILPSGELRLPKNRIAGHRQYRLYYRQRLPDNARKMEQIRAQLLQGSLVGSASALQPLSYAQLRRLQFDLVPEHGPRLRRLNQQLQTLHRAAEPQLRQRARTSARKATRHNFVLSRHFRVQFRQ